MGGNTGSLVKSVDDGKFPRKYISMQSETNNNNISF